MDDQKWSQWVEVIGPRIYRYFKYKGANDLASDLTQDTFIRLVNNCHKFQPSQGPFVAFALGFAQNIWREYRRKLKLTENFEDHEELIADTHLHQQFEALDQSEKLKIIVRRLPQVQQDILYFYFDEEMTTREIADVLEIPEGTIKSHLHRSKETIRMILEKEWK